MRHGEAARRTNAGSAAAHVGLGQAMPRADVLKKFTSRFVYLPDDLPSASPALSSKKQQEEMMLRLSNQFHSFGLSHAGEQSDIPAGYTYLAQFAIHDMLRSTPLVSRDGATAVNPDNEESAGLDLRSLYGSGPDKSPELYKSGPTAGKKGRLRIGHLNKASNALPPRFEKGAMADVPRDPAARSAPGALPTEPALADDRNADTLILAQLTALFIRFHNILFDMSNNAGDADPFLRARKMARAAYRNIVWNDVVKRLTGDEIFAHYDPSLALPRETGWNVPKESAFAVLRFGHAMVREAYQLSGDFEGVSAAARVGKLLQFFNSATSQKLPPAQIWKIEWSRFFQTGQNHGAGFNRSAPIRPAMAQALKELSKKRLAAFPSKEEAQISLAYRALMRGFLIGLPSGQASAARVSATLGFGIRTLTLAEIKGWLTAAAGEGLCKLGSVQCLTPDDIAILAERTPLFLYVLLEAQIIGGGSKLGPVGSDFLCHAFAGGLRLPPDDPDKNIASLFGIVLPGTMPELLGFLEQHSTPDV